MRWKLENLIGMLIRDIVVYHSGEFVEYFYYNGLYTYLFPWNFSFSIGRYTFLKKEDYTKEKINNLVK